MKRKRRKGAQGANVSKITSMKTRMMQKVSSSSFGPAVNRLFLGLKPMVIREEERKSDHWLETTAGRNKKGIRELSVHLIVQDLREEKIRNMRSTNKPVYGLIAGPRMKTQPANHRAFTRQAVLLKQILVDHRVNAANKKQEIEEL